MRSRFDWPLILAILALAAISLSVIFSIDRQLATNQLIFWLLGLSLFWVVSRAIVQLWQKLAIPAYLATIISLVLVFLIGEEIRGALRWIDLGIFRFQPSEIAKLTTIVILSTFYLKKTAGEFPNIVTSLIIIAPIFLLIFRQPDIGSALSIIAIWAGISYVAKINKKTALTLFLATLIILPLIFNFIAPYQKQRLTAFINPREDPLGSGYNIIQSKIAVGSGLLLGRGLGRGSQSQLNFLPEAESDFIFAAIVEELGLLGGGTVVLIFIFILLRIHAALENKDSFAQLLATGTLALLTYQIMVNIGMNLGLIPVTGITLPLVSYGGSSLITTLVLLGIVSLPQR